MKPQLTFLLAASVLLAGCQHSRQTQLERVAKDWCATIRASQVIPVYPLTEDLEPGDIFLVQSPLAEQRSLYASRGYLPFENQLGRLRLDQPANQYLGYYRSGYDVSAANVPPRHWQFPRSVNWTNAPIAGFPTYTFSVKNSKGLNAAFPISGVPVGLGLANASSANGSVTLSRAHTYGLDEATMEDSFAAWRRNHRDLLARHASRPGHASYLRVVTRVYVVHQFDVSLEHSGSTSGGLTVGAGKPIDLSSPDAGDLIKNYTNSLSALNKLLERTESTLPGGALSVAAASSRSISLKETFARPIVVGYLASEYMILDNGELGPSLSTREILEQRLLDPTATSRAIREEQRAAGDLAGKIMARLKECPDASCLNAAVGKAKDLGILQGGAPEHVLQTIQSSLDKGRIAFSELLFDYAGGGSFENRCALHKLLAALTPAGASRKQ